MLKTNKKYFLNPALNFHWHKLLKWNQTIVWILVHWEIFFLFHYWILMLWPIGDLIVASNESTTSDLWTFGQNSASPNLRPQLYRFLLDKTSWLHGTLNHRLCHFHEFIKIAQCMYIVHLLLFYLLMISNQVYDW